ncbi:MAG: LemA family protein [Myxococcales bacterium]|nr:LemA family protein [Myxococcales bacterium]
MSLLLWVALGAAAVYAISQYNGLVRLRNGSEGAWSDIDVQLKRRYELIPNLVETVKGFATHERETFEEVTRARSSAMGAQGVEQQAAAEGGLSRALASLFAVAEAYPELKSNENFLSLQSELSDLEDAIQNARRYYNAIVRDLNTRVEAFPSNLVANVFSFGKKEYFELDAPAERIAPKVSFAE